MTITPDWGEIGLRLALTILAGALIGINRGEHGRPAGLRTTLLVCLAASITMIQANLMMAAAGKAPDSFISLDLMRLPLGILSGMGFIGGGVILRRDNLILGVTTAATLWFVTVIGLCFGGGQLALGSAALTLGLVVLCGLKWAEMRLPQDRQATLTATLGPGAPTVDEVCGQFRAAGYRILALGLVIEEGRRREIRCEMQWRERPTDPGHLAKLEELVNLPGVSRVSWNPQGLPAGAG